MTALSVPAHEGTHTMSRISGADDTAGRDGRPDGRMPGVPRWAELATTAVHLAVLPSGLWRIALVAGVPVIAEYDPTWWEPYYIVSLTLVSEALALLTYGLIRPWGEVVPDWVPFVAGRRIPPRVAVIPAALGGVALTAIFGFAGFTAIAYGLDFGSTLQNALVAICYAPLLAWGPLLLAITVAYWRRRTGGASTPTGEPGGADRARSTAAPLA